MRARKRFRCSSFERWRKNLRIRVPLRWRCASSSTMERYRSLQMALSAIKSAGGSRFEGAPDAPERRALLVVRTVEDPDPPASGSRVVVRQRKSCWSSSALGCLKLKTSQPSGLTPDMTCRIAPSLPAPSIPWKISAAHIGRTRNGGAGASSARRRVHSGALIVLLRRGDGVDLVGHAPRSTWWSGGTR